MKISIIIPVLNEEENIGKLLAHLKENSHSSNIAEIIAVDGGSTDATVRLAKEGGACVLSSEKGRAKQMNTGATAAKGDILYFLHADSFPPKNFDRCILDEVNKGNMAGCFRMHFDSSHPWLWLAGWFTRFNLRHFRGGDQSQFITKQLFDEIGGYDEVYIIYEDNILINELYKRKQFVVIPQWLSTSARRYQESGIWKLQYHFWVIHLKKRFGATAEELYAYYAKNIKPQESNLPASPTQKIFLDK